MSALAGGHGIGMRKLFLPRSDVKRLPDMAEIIFCGALMSSSPVPGPPLFSAETMRAIANESSGSNLSWSWPPEAWWIVVMSVADQLAWSEVLELERDAFLIKCCCRVVQEKAR